MRWMAGCCTIGLLDGRGADAPCTATTPRHARAKRADMPHRALGRATRRAKRVGMPHRLKGPPTRRSLNPYVVREMLGERVEVGK